MALLTQNHRDFGSLPGSSLSGSARAAIAALRRLSCGMLLCLALTPAHAEHPEYEIKAAFIHNIAKFVEWPAAPHAASALKLCVLGSNPFGKALDTLRDKQVGEMRWEPTAINSKSNLKGCGVLFIAASESGDLGRILDDLKGSTVLTLGDTDGYADQGVMVNFYLDGDKVRFEINLESANRAGIRLSSKLLKIGKVIGAPK